MVQVGDICIIGILIRVPRIIHGIIFIGIEDAFMYCVVGEINKKGPTGISFFQESQCAVS